MYMIINVTANMPDIFDICSSISRVVVIFILIRYKIILSYHNCSLWQRFGTTSLDRLYDSSQPFHLYSDHIFLNMVLLLILCHKQHNVFLLMKSVYVSFSIFLYTAFWSWYSVVSWVHLPLQICFVVFTPLTSYKSFEAWASITVFWIR